MDMDSFIKDIEHDEIKDGFLVTSGRKRIWNKSLEIWNVFHEICKKYDIRYFADYGTLLGAVRHKGFVPWDDDLDFVMFRPEYERFLQCAAKELREPYFLQTTYTDGLTTAYAKIRDSRTTAVEYPDAPYINQGMFIDIFPLDTVSDGSRVQNEIFLMEKELWAIIVKADFVCNARENGYRPHIGMETLERLLTLPREEQMRVFEAFCQEHYGKSDQVNFITDELCNMNNRVYRSWYDEIVWLPFEKIMLPAPQEYDKVLTGRYGEYQKYVRGAACHAGIEFSVDIPYQTYMANIVREQG